MNEANFQLDKNYQKNLLIYQKESLILKYIINNNNNIWKNKIK